MNAEILVQIIAIIVPIILAAGAGLWAIATIKSNLEKQITTLAKNISKSQDERCDELEDLIKELEKKFEIYQTLQKSERRAWKNEVALHFDRVKYSLAEINKKHKETRHDINDIQQFLQNKLSFKVRSNRDTLSDKPTDR